MNLQKWSYFFATTVCIGGGMSLLSGLSLQIFQDEMGNFNSLVDFLLNIVQLLLSGCMISIYSQMGFFAYLTLHYIALGLFKKSWPYIQLLLTMMALFDFMFLRMLLVDKPNEEGRGSSYEDIMLAIVIFGVALFVCYLKVKATNASALIATLFFMTTITIVEMLATLPIRNITTWWFMYIPLVLCNAYQILILHHILRKA